MVGNLSRRRNTLKENVHLPRGIVVCAGSTAQPVKFLKVKEASTEKKHNTCLGEDGSPSRRSMTLCSESRMEAARPTPLLTPRKNIRLATWNVRTMYASGTAAQVAREMKRYKLGLLGLSETRWLESGQMRLASGEQILYSGHTEPAAPHNEGVALMLTPEAQGALIGWEPVSSRLIFAKFTTKKKNIKLNVVQCYAPTNEADDERKDDFYHQLQSLVD